MRASKLGSITAATFLPGSPMRYPKFRIVPMSRWSKNASMGSPAHPAATIKGSPSARLDDRVAAVRQGLRDGLPRHPLRVELHVPLVDHVVDVDLHDARDLPQGAAHVDRAAGALETADGEDDALVGDHQAHEAA